MKEKSSKICFKNILYSRPLQGLVRVSYLEKSIYLGGKMEIGEINKGRDKIIVALKEFKGKSYVDIRTYFENDEGKWLPTKKGITFSPELLDDVLKLLNEAKKKLQENANV